jgi:hypothetical protein
MEFPKIETLYERDEQTFKVRPGVLRNTAYGLINRWQFTEKIDGTNIRCMWRDGTVTFGGRTDNAQIHADLVKHLYETVSPKRLDEVFHDTPVILYGEGYGAGIQKGGSYSPTKRFILFDVLVADKWWLNWHNTCDVADRLRLDVVPMIGEDSLENMTDFVRGGFPSKLGEHPSAEGVVGRTAEPLFDKHGNRLIVKLKTKDFA